MCSELIKKTDILLLIKKKVQRGFMKKLLIGLLLLSSMSTFAGMRYGQLAKFALKYNLAAAVHNSFGLYIADINYSEDREALNVFFDEIACYRVTLNEKNIGGKLTLAVTRSVRDFSCDKHKYE